jgi:ribulose kinase
MPETEIRNCLSCGKPVRGRVDKKFCDDYCRNAYNNAQKAPAYNFVRNINNQLAKNRRLLEEAIPAGEEMGKTTKEKLLAKGFPVFRGF